MQSLQFWSKIISWAFQIRERQLLYYVFIRRYLCMLQEVVQQIKQSGHAQYVNGSMRHLHIIQMGKNRKVDGQKKMESLQIELSTKVPAEFKSQLTKIVEKNMKEHKREMDFEISQKKGTGQVFGDYGEISKLFEEGAAKVAAQQGQVLLVDVWATWCGPCQGPMDHNQKMLEKNQWGDKVRIVGVSVDDNKDTVKERVQSKGWKSVEHLCLGKWDNEHLLIKDFQISGIPFVCLVDTKGIINYIGHPSSINMEQRINELLKGGSQEKMQEKKESNEDIPPKVIEEMMQTFSNEEWMAKNFEEAVFLSMKLDISSHFSKGALSNKIEIKVYGTKKDEGVLEKFEKLVPVGVKFTKKIIQEIDVPQSPEACSSCQKQLKYPLYWCKWNNDEFRCRECVEKKNQATYYEFLNNSILLMAPTQAIPKINIKSNIQPPNVKDVTEPNLFGCNGCSGCPDKIGVARYVCLMCRSEPNYYGDYVDVCDSCICKYIEGDIETAKNLDSDGHTKQHAFVRVLFNFKGYYDY